MRVGTVFESSHIPLHKWLMAAYLLCSSKKGISSHQIHRTMGVTYKTAWFMAHRIREAMREGVAVCRLADLARSWKWMKPLSAASRSAKRPRASGHKHRVLSLVERGGRVRSFHVEESKMKNIVPIVSQNISHESHLMTDENPVYGRLSRSFKGHDTVLHRAEEYARYERGRLISTNTIEGFFSIFKRGMTGIYQHCGENHLHRYIAEFDFRYSERGVC